MTKTPSEFSKEEIAKRAEELISDPILQFALAEVERRYLENWRLSKFNDTAAREACWLGVKSLEDIQAQLNSLASAPKVEAFNKSLRAKHK
jgi:hypothetical protein